MSAALILREPYDQIFQTYLQASITVGLALGGAMCSHEDTIKALWTSMGWW